jgi:hypothetical protein
MVVFFVVETIVFPPQALWIQQTDRRIPAMARNAPQPATAWGRHLMVWSGPQHLQRGEEREFFFAKVECLKIFGLCVLLVSATSIGCQPFWFWTVRGQPWLIFLEGFGLDPCHKTWVRATEAPNVCCHDNIETWSIPSQLSIRFLYWVCHASMILVAYWSEQMLEMRNDRDFIPSFNGGYGKAPWAQRFGSQV